MSENDLEPFRPGYKEPWFWFIVSPMLALFISVPLLLYTAINKADDRVVDNYYKEGRMLAKRFDAEQFARDLGVAGALEIDWQSGELFLNVMTELSAESVTLKLSHPAKKKFDQELTLLKVAPKQYLGQAKGFSKGRWYLRIEGVHEQQQWRVDQDVDLRSSSYVQIFP